MQRVHYGEARSACVGRPQRCLVGVAQTTASRSRWLYGWSMRAVGSARLSELSGSWDGRRAVRMVPAWSGLFTFYGSVA